MYKFALNSNQMHSIEAPIIRNKDTSLDLMHKAGKEVFDEIFKRFKPCKVLVICGFGNNGGDGYVVANLLHQNSWDVKLLKLGEPKTNSAKYYAKKYKGKIIDINNLNLEETDLIIDAIYGIGLSKEIDVTLKELIHKINNSNLKCISIDIPTGISENTGEILGAALKATLTITFHTKKIGHLLMPGLKHSGEVIVKDIGLSNLENTENYIKINTPEIWKNKLRFPQYEDNKYTRGCLGIIAGEMLGASILSTQAARKSGSGIVKLFIKNNVQFDNKLDAGIVIIKYKDIQQLNDLIIKHKVSSILYGPGTIASSETHNIVKNILKHNKPIVLDAGAIINYKSLKKLTTSNQDVLITPHEGEFKKIFNLSSELKINKVKLAVQLSNCKVLLKGVDTVIGCNDNILLQENGCPYLSTAGTGDVLAGICAGLMSQGLNSYFAASIAVWTLNEAAWKIGYGLVAEEIPQTIPNLLLQFRNPSRKI